MSRSCKNNKLVSGKPLFLCHTGRKWLNAQGWPFCFPFNSFRGCITQGPSCRHRSHLCLLCSSNHATQAAEKPSFLLVKTPLKHCQWKAALTASSLYDSFFNIVHSIRDGFNFGAPIHIEHTYTPKNHSSAYTNPSVIDQYIHKECTAGHYTGPFSCSHLEAPISPFRTSPLGLVP